MDSGADISLVKSKKLLETAEFEPRDRERVKNIDGSMFETQGSIETRIMADGVDIPYSFQLASQQIDLKGDGILGRDFLKAMQAGIFYKEKLLTFQYEGVAVRKKLGPLPGSESETSLAKRGDRLTLPARTETTVRLPVSVGSHVTEGLAERSEKRTGVNLTG